MADTSSVELGDERWETIKVTTSLRVSGTRVNGNCIDGCPSVSTYRAGHTDFKSWLLATLMIAPYFDRYCRAYFVSIRRPRVNWLVGLIDRVLIL